MSASRQDAHEVVVVRSRAVPVVVDDGLVTGQGGMDVEGLGLPWVQANGLDVQCHEGRGGRPVRLFIDLGPVLGVHPKRGGGGFLRDPHGEWAQTASDSQAANDDVIDGQQVLALDGKHDSAERVIFVIGRFDGNFVVNDVRGLGGSVERCHAAAAAECLCKFM